METYVWISKLAHHPVYIKHAHHLLKRLEKLYNVSIEITGPDDTSSELYINSLNKAIDRKVDGIMMIGWGEDRIIPVVNRAINSHIPLVTVECDIPGSKRLAHVGTDWFEMGGIMADNTAQLINGTGDVLLLGITSLPNAQNGLVGFQRRIEQFSNIRIIGNENEFDYNSLPTESIVAEYISRYPDLAGIAAFNGNSGAVAAIALEKAGKENKIKLLCVDAEEDQLSFIRSGAIDIAFCHQRESFTFQTFRMLYEYNHGSYTSNFQPGLINIPGNISTGAILVTRDNLDTFETVLSIEETLNRHVLSSRIPLSSGIIENTSEIALSTDTDGRIVYCNPATIEAFGFNQVEIYQLTVNDLFNLTRSQKKKIRQCSKNGVSSSFETNAMKQDGSTFPVQLSIAPIMTDDAIQGVGVIAIDITSSKLAQDTLRQSEEDYRSIFDNSTDAILILDFNTYEVQDVNHRMLEMFGYKPSESSQINLKGLCVESPPYAIEDILKILDKARKGSHQSAEWLARDKSERLLWVKANMKTAYLGQRKSIMVFLEDITARKQAEKAFQESEQKYQGIIETMNDGFVILDENGIVTYANDRLLEMIGYARRKTIGSSIMDFLDEKNRNVFTGDANKRKKGAKTAYELEWIKKDGSILSTIMSPRAVFDSAGRFKGSFAVITDITELKRVESALRTNEEKFQQVVENAHEWIWEVDCESIYTYSSPVVESILGYKPEELVGKKHFYDLFHKDDLKELNESAAIIFSNQEPIQSFVNRNIHKDGRIVWLITSGVPIMDDNGEWIGYRGADIDITNHRMAEEALQISEKRYRRLFEMNLAGVYHTTLDGEVIDCNESFAQMLGYESRKDVLMQDATNFYLEKKDRADFIAKLKKESYVTNYECELKKKDGSPVWLLENVNLVRDSCGEPVYIQGTIINISERKRMEESLRESEERFRTVVENSHEGIVIINDKYRIEYVNDEMELIIGYNKEEIIDSDFRKYIHKDNVKDVVENYWGRREGIDIPSRYNFQLVRKNGEVRQVEVSVSIIRCSSGSTQTIGEIIDITDRKHAEEALKERERFLVDVFEGIKDGICVIDNDFNIIRTNPSIEKWFSHSMSLVGKKCYQAFRFEESVCEDCPCLKTLQTGEPEHQIVSRLTAEGCTQGWFDLFSFPLVNPVSKKVTGIIGYYRDISERIRAGQLQNALYRIAQHSDKSRDMDDLYGAMHEIVADVMHAKNFYIALYNENDDQISFPYFKDEADTELPPVDVGKGLTNYVLRTGESLLCTQDVNDKLVRSGEIEVIGAASPNWLGVPLKVEGKTIGVMAVQHYSDPNAYGIREKNMLEFVSNEIANAIQRKRAEKALIESKEKYQVVIDNSLEGIFIAQKNIIRFCNRRFVKMFGYKEPKDVLQKNLRELVSPHSWGTVDIELRKCEEGSRKMTHFNFLARHPEGSDFEVETLCSRIVYEGENAIQGVLRDVSEQRGLEAQLRQAQKMEAIGRLAGGIAHDFNNLLTVITGHSEFAKMALSENDPLFRDIEEIFKAAEKASNLTGQLLAFSRKQTMELKVVDLNTIITNMDRMLQRLIGENIELITLPEKNLHKVKADPGQIEQVIVNLAVNSRDAMPRGGKLTIETENVDLDAQYIRSHPGVDEGTYVMLAVSDTGIGMTEEVRAKVFDPFFTTKEEGIGTGLGLSMIYGIIKQIHGNVWIYSEPGNGTCVKIYLPIVTDEEDEIILKPEYIDVPGGKETILVVEDEQSVRELAVRTLKHMGYNVFDAQNGGEAFLLCESREEPFDLIITDVIMPKMSGADLIKRLDKMWSDLKVLYMSGYTANVIVNEGILKPGTPYIQKPFRLQALAKKVRDVLDS